MEFQWSYFRSWKMKACESVAVNVSANLENSTVATGLEKVSFQSQRKAMPKNAQTTTQLHSSHASNVMLKILQARLQQYVNHELPDVQACFRKGRGTRDEITNICCIIEKQENSRKTISALLNMPKLLTVWITTNYGKFWKRWEYQTTLPTSWETCMQVRKQQLELDMEQQTGSKLGKEYVKAVHCHPVYLTYMQSTSCEMLAGWRTSWSQDCWEKYQ